MNRLFLIILISAISELCRGCAVRTNQPIENVLKENQNSPWLVVVGDQSNQPNKDLVIGISYGAIIHPTVVITSAIVSKVRIRNVVVFSNCKVRKGIRCRSSSAIGTLTSPNVDKKKPKPEDPMALLLEEPLKFTSTVSAVALASGDDYDPDDCVIHHWQSVASEDESKSSPGLNAGIVHAEYKVSLNPSNFGMSESEQSKMIDDLDCFLADCWVIQESSDDSMMINFMGSPIVCKENDTQVLVGLSTYSFDVIIGKDVATDVSLTKGTLVKFSSDPDFVDQVIPLATSS